LSSPFIERRAGQGVRASVDNKIVIAAEHDPEKVGTGFRKKIMLKQKARSG